MASQRHRISTSNRFRLLLLSIATALTLACNKDPVGVEDDRLPAADMRVLFIGNSLTYTNNLPSMVQTIAEATGYTMVFGIAAAPNVSLEDHWRNGVEGTIRTVEADVVVMQQGPSSGEGYQGIEELSVDEKDMVAHILSAHRTLMELSDANKATFQNVVDFMEQQAREKYGGKKGD